jgi:serine/threonine protein kinase/tetratricopeptide (TPR) repeat protein
MASETQPETVKSSAIRTAHLACGEIIADRYEVLEELGEGGMGSVYKVHDRELGRVIALKTIRPDLASNASTIRRFKQELLLARQISHPNVIRIYDLGIAGGLRFLTMDFVDGVDLRSLLNDRGKFPPEEATDIIQQICAGLQAAHAEHVIHRDLKPQNILVDKQGQVRILDFGVARTLEQSSITHTGVIVGTAVYMSPEQARGDEIDSRSDLFSLGLIFYELLTGVLPFADGSIVTALLRRTRERALPLQSIEPSIPAWISDIVTRCLEPDPNHRYQCAAEIACDLDHQGAPRHTSAPAAPKALRMQASAESIKARPRAYVWSLTSIIAAIIIAALVFSIFRFQAPATSRIPQNGKYVAVLPFRSLSADGNLKYEAEGISDAITSRLFSVRGVHPVSQAALERVDFSRGQDALAHELGANLIVRGEVQGAGDRLNVIVSIDNVENHTTLWSKSFPGMRGDLLSIQDNICNQVLAALDIVPSNDERAHAAVAPSQNMAAYDLYLKGRDLLKNQRSAEAAERALDLFQQACQKDPSFALAWTGIADASLLIYRVRKEAFWAEKALSAAQEGLSRNPDIPEVHFALGSVYAATGRHTQAVDELKRALALAPNSDIGYIRLGNAYLDAGKREAALAALKNAVEINPYYWYNHKQLGVAYARFGNNHDALGEFQRQVELNPKDPSGYNNLGAIYAQERHWKEAIAQFEKAIALAPSYEEYSNLATIYYHLGRYSDAVATYERAMEVNPNHATALRNLGYAYQRAGNADKASVAFDRAIELAYKDLEVNPRDTSAMQNLALCYIEKGAPSKALKFIKDARGIDATDKDLMYTEAVIQARSQRRHEALSALERALENGYSVEYARADPALKQVCAMPEFAAFVAKLR